MEFPKNITFKKVGKKGGKITATFSTTDMPDFIWIKGTEDLRRVRKNDKLWVSRAKYNTLAMNLLFLDDVNGIVEQAYDASGAIILPIVNLVNFGSESIEVASKNITLNWSTSDENNLTQFIISRQDDPNGDYNELGRVPAQGVNTPYSYVDKNVATGSYNYSWTAVYKDGTTALVYIDTVDVS